MLGAPLRGGKLSPILAERVAAAVELYRRGGGELVVATGGPTAGEPRAEADAIGEALVERGVPEAAVIVEAESRTTRENAERTAELLRPRGARSVWVVTQPFHGRRAAHLFARVGLSARVWHIADSLEYRHRRRALGWLVREYGAWARLAVANVITPRATPR